jgi:hypothetical protein
MGWTGGTIYGNWSIITNGVLTMSGSGTKYFGGSVTNGGTMTLAGSGLFQFAGFNLQLVNQPGGRFDVQGDETINNGGYTGLQIVNAGTFHKSAGTNTATVSGIACQNTGTLSALSGILNFTSAFTNAGGGLAIRLNSATDWGRFAFSSSLALNGLLQVAIANGFAPAQGSQLQLISSGSLSGTFASLNIPVGTSVNYNNNSVFLVVGSVVPAQLFNITNARGNFGFSFGTVNGQSYTIERNDDVATTNWIFYTNFTGNGSIIQIVTPVTNASHRFFRVREP